eukprot:g1358.t1
MFPTRVLVDGATLPAGYGITSWNDTTIITSINPGQGVNHVVQVESAGERSESVDNARFSYAPPEITDVNPKFGPTDGSVPVTIEGRNFGTPSAEITVTYRYGSESFKRAFDASLGHIHNHFNISKFPMPAGQGGEAVMLIVSVSGQSSAEFRIVPPTTPVSVIGYPDAVSLTGAYLPPILDSIKPNSGPTSGCNVFESIQLWRQRNREGNAGPRLCMEKTQITMKGSSFGLSGSKGDAQIELRSLDDASVWYVIANATDGNIIEHTHTRIVFNAPQGLGANRRLRLRVGGQILPNNDVAYNFLGPSSLDFSPRPIDARGAGELEIRAQDGFGETETNVGIRFGGQLCNNASWQPEHKETGRPYIVCTPSADVAGSKAISFDVGESRYEYLPNFFDKGFVFDFTPCEPTEACLGANECSEGYEGFVYACNAWYNSQGNGSRSCLSNRDCMTKSGNEDVLTECSSARPEDCAVCDKSGVRAPDGFGTCKCTPGPRCGRCTLGGNYGGIQVKSYFRTNGACEKCPENVELIIAAFVVAMIFFISGASWLSKKDVNMAFIPIGVDYFQVLAIFTGSNIPWPSYIATILQWFSFFNVNIDITAPECLAPNLSYGFKFYLTLMSPVVALTFMIFLMIFRIIMNKCCKSCVATGFEKFDWRGYISVYLIIIYFLYLTVTRRALEIFTCNPTTPFDGYYWSTFSDPACPFGLCRCYDPSRHEDTKGFLQRNYIPWALVFLCVYTVGFPVLVATIICKNKKFIKQDQLLRAYGLGNSLDLSTDNIWRTRIKYRELLTVAVIAVLFYSNPGFQLALTILVLFSSYVLQVRNRPYMSDLEKRLQVTFHEHAVEQKNAKHVEIESIISRVKRKAALRKNQRLSIRQVSFDPRDALALSNKQSKTSSSGSAQEYFFDYNTVELVLIGTAIVVCAAGIMFTSGRFENRPDLQWQQDLIGTAVVILVVVSLLYYLIIVFVELVGAGGQKALAKSIMSKLGRRDKNAEIAKKLDDKIEGGDVEMAINPMNHRDNENSQRELELLKKQTESVAADNARLLEALRHQKSQASSGVQGRARTQGKSRPKRNAPKKEFTARNVPLRGGASSEKK